jgi:hypothetical protein
VSGDIQDRYDDIVKISGLSEEIVRRVFKATRQSIAKSLKNGEKGIIPGIVTVVPVVRNRLDIGGETMSQYVKLKAVVSSAVENEMLRNQYTETSKEVEINVINSLDGQYQIATKQIGALM